MKNFMLLTFIFLNVNLYGFTFQDAEEACTKNESKKVLKIYDELLKVDNLKAKEKLVGIYNWGSCGIPKNYLKARKLMIEIANTGDRTAAMAVGVEYLVQDDIKDLKKAHYWFTKDVDITDAKVQYEIATKYSLYGYHDESLTWYLKSARQNYKMSFYWLGKIYLYGLGNTLKNPRDAIYWWEKGANLGDYSCMEMVSKEYGYLGNKEKELYWLEKAAGRKSSYKTQYYVGEMYFDRDNKKKAAYWIKEAHKNGSEDAKEFWDKNELWKYE